MLEFSAPEVKLSAPEVKLSMDSHVVMETYCNQETQKAIA